jgi:hypothetical protein
MIRLLLASWIHKREQLLQPLYRIRLTRLHLSTACSYCCAGIQSGNALSRSYQSQSYHRSFRRHLERGDGWQAHDSQRIKGSRRCSSSKYADNLHRWCIQTMTVPGANFASFTIEVGRCGAHPRILLVSTARSVRHAADVPRRPLIGSGANCFKCMFLSGEKTLQILKRTGQRPKCPERWLLFQLAV